MTTVTRPAPGTSVSVVYYEGAAPTAFPATLESHEPLVLVSRNPVCQGLRSGCRALLAYQVGNGCFKAEFENAQVREERGAWRIVAPCAEWDTVDRRRYPRFLVERPASLRIVAEREGCVASVRFDGWTSNLSMGGAGIRAKEAVARGSLINVTVAVTELDYVRALGMVAWTNASGQFGVEFLDFIGDSRRTLHEFLATLH